MLAALDVFSSDRKLPITHRNDSRIWRLGQVTPMNGQIIFEYLNCDPSDAFTSHHDQSTKCADPQQTPIPPPQNATFVRININDSIVTLPNCTSGPGSSCPLADFLALVERRGKEVGDFKTVCGLEDDMPGSLDFLHQ